MNSSINSNTPFSPDVSSLAKAPDKTENAAEDQKVSDLANKTKVSEVQESAYATNKKQLNSAIIESSLKFNSTASNQPQSLVLKAALQGINEALKETGVESSVEDAYESAVDFSPETTAERIVSSSTQFFSSYQKQHPEMNEEELLTTFVEMISGGINQGFGEARDILDGLHVLEGDVGNNIDKTYELVQAGIQSFVDSYTKNEDEQT